MPNFIKHIAFKVENVDTERAFYENVFGYTHVNTVRRKGKTGDHISHHMTDGYMDLTLIHYEASNADEADFAGPAPCIHHIGMEVEDLDAFIALIKKNGGEILTAPDRDQAASYHNMIKDIIIYQNKPVNRRGWGISRILPLDACADIFKHAEYVNYFKASGYDTG